MAFKRFEFNFNPPPTVAVSPEPVSTTSAAQQARIPSNSSQVINRLQDLSKTAAYLEAVILDRTSSLGITLDHAADPDTARSLIQVYGTDEPPSAITVPMYNRLLDAELGATQLELALPPDSPIEPNPFQAADVAHLTKTVEANLGEGDSFIHHLPLLLRQLKGDQVIFTQWQRQLSDYPASSNAAPPPIESLNAPIVDHAHRLQLTELDLSPELNTYMNGYFDRYSRAYSSTYKLLSEPNPIEKDLPSVANVFFAQPVTDLIRLVGVLEALKGLVLKPRLSNIADDLTQFVFVRLLADAGSHMFHMDQFMQISVSAFKLSTGPVIDLLTGAQKTVSINGRVTGGSLRNLSSINLTNALPHNSLSSEVVGGLLALGGILDWSTHEAGRKNVLIQESFFKLAERRNNVNGDRLNLLSILQAVEATLLLARGFIGESRRGNVITINNNNQRLETVGRILSSLKSSDSAKFAIQDGQFVITPPTLPAVPAAVERVLRTGGLDRITVSDIRVIKTAL